MFSEENDWTKLNNSDIDNYSVKEELTQRQSHKIITHIEFLRIRKPVSCDSFCFDCPNEYNELHLTATTSVNRSMLTIDGKKTRINESNYRMLCALHNHPGVTLSREFLLEYVWGIQGKVANNVNVMVSELRSHLQNSGLEIVTIRGKGYRMLNKSKREYRL